MKKNKFVTLTLCAAMLAATLTGCGGNAKPQENDNSNGDAKEPVSISFMTAATTGTVYPLGSAIATLWNDELDYVNASATASNGGVENLNFIREGEAQIGVAVTSIMYESMQGTGAFEGNPDPNLRVLAGLYYNPNQVVVSADSGIEKLTDLKGKRFAPGSPGGTSEVETKYHLTAAGMTYPDDIDAQYVGFTEASDLMRNKQLDGAWIMAGVPTAAVTEITSTAGGKLVPIDESLIEQLQETYPWYAKYTIPAGTYSGQDEDVMTSAIKITICTSADVPDDVIYDLTKTFWENIDSLSESQNILKSCSVEEAVTDLAGLPIHDGAARYYKEVGVLQ